MNTANNISSGASAAAKLLIALIILSANFTAMTALSAPDLDRDTEQKISVLLSRMTLEEKFGQLQQLDGTGEGDARPEHFELTRRGLLGSTLNVRGVKRTTELQRTAMTESRLKIPILFAFDVIHGYRTIFPVPLGEAASWDPQVAEQSASIAAAEASACGVRWTFAPMVDIARDPRWGRIVEGAGEDTFLGVAMARARVLGFQGTNYSQPDKVIACAKHWVAYGAAEGGRDYNSTDVSERTLRQVYFPPFKAAVDAGVATFMSAFNDLNGIPCTANRFILTDVLRGEWGFDGFVVTDYTSMKELIAHGFAADAKEAATYAMAAGVDMEMVSRLYNEDGPELVRQGKISAGALDEAVRRVLRVKYRLGLFDHPYGDETREQGALLTPKNLETARTSAARTFVLLRNEKATLPISTETKTIALVGPLADDAQSMMGSWAGDGRTNDTVTLLAGLRARSGLKINYAKGCDVIGDSTNEFAAAINAARDSEFVVVAVGESSAMTGEATSRNSLDLPGRQLELVQAIHDTCKPYAVVLMNGRPLSINWIATNSPAILETWFAGSQGGHAIADVLLGNVNPGGKLPVTFPRSVGQVPIYYNHKNTGRPPGTDPKYASMYIDVSWTPLYPFGFGLSYTQFKLSGLELSTNSIGTNDTVLVEVNVENTGHRQGDEVVQLYIRHVAASVTQPIKELRGFKRVNLQPGDSQRVSFNLGPPELSFYNREMRFGVEPGVIDVMVGTDSQETLATRFVIVSK